MEKMNCAFNKGNNMYKYVIFMKYISSSSVKKIGMLLCFIAFALSVNAQPRKVTGQILDESGQPIIGATIRLQDSPTGTITDIDGHFSLDVPEGKKVVVSYIGYIKQTFVPKSNTLNIVLQEDNQKLDEVVVVGYGSMKQKNITGSVSTISAEELERAYRNEGIVVDEMFFPDADNVIPITDEEYLDDDIVSRLCAWLKAVYGADTLEANLDYVAKALGNKGSTSREIIRNYFLNDFFKDHCQTYSVTGSGKRPIYWLFDSGKQNGFKALVYLHRYTPDTIGNLRIDYLHKMQRVYESEINRMQDMMDHSENAREVAAAGKRKDKLAKQLKECREYDEKISHLALSRIELDLDDGVKVNYRKLQTAQDGKFYEVLADSKNIMVKEKK